MYSMGHRVIDKDLLKRIPFFGDFVSLFINVFL